MRKRFLTPYSKLSRRNSFSVTAGGVPALCRADKALPFYNARMMTLTVRLPEAVVAQIDAESRGRKVSKSDVVRERLSVAARPSRRRHVLLDAIADLVGSVDRLPADLSARKKAYLKTTGHGQKRGR